MDIVDKTAGVHIIYFTFKYSSAFPLLGGDRIGIFTLIHSETAESNSFAHLL